MLSQPSLRLQLLLCLFLLAVWLPGCTYLHNPQKATLAKETVEEFKKFQTSTASVNETMLANLQKTEDKLAQRRTEIAVEKSRSFLNRLPGVTWGQIHSEMAALGSAQESSAPDVTGAVRDMEKKLGTKPKTIQDTQAGLERAQALLASAVNEQNLWEARRAFLRASLTEAAKLAASSDKDFNVTTASASLDQVLGQKITVLNPDGVGTSEKNLQEVLKKDLTGITPGNVQEVLWKFTGAQFDPKKAPGLTVIILGLAVDLANAKVARATLDTDYLQQRLAAIQNSQMPLTNANTAKSLARRFPANEKVLGTLNRLRQKNKEGDLSAALTALSCYSLAATQDESQANQAAVKPAILDHEYSIRLSAVNGREHEALISRSLQGLALYYDGGVRPETIANFLSAAQGVALAVIAAGVL